MGDVSEAVRGFIRGNNVTPDEVKLLRERLRIVRWNDAAGASFLKRLKAEHAVWPFDLVNINPLFSFCGCAISDQKDMSAFLPNGLKLVVGHRE